MNEKDIQFLKHVLLTHKMELIKMNKAVGKSGVDDCSVKHCDRLIEKLDELKITIYE